VNLIEIILLVPKPEFGHGSALPLPLLGILLVLN